MDPLNQIADLTCAMAQAGAAGDWERVEAFEEARYALLSALPPSRLASGDPAVKSVLEQALDVTNTLLTQARAAQGQQAGSLRELHRGQRGAQAYLAAEG
jgi:hypothetical protein